jgi:hypothetical protein
MRIRHVSLVFLVLAFAVLAGPASAQTWTPEQQEIWAFEDQQWKMEGPRTRAGLTRWCTPT